MPIRLDPTTTTIRKIVVATIGDRKGREQEPANLYLARNAELRFFAPVNEPARPTTGVRQALSQAIANDLVESDAHWANVSPSNRAIWADTILRHVLQDRDSPTFGELRTLAKLTRQLTVDAMTAQPGPSAELTQILTEAMAEVHRRETTLSATEAGPVVSAFDELRTLQPFRSANLLLARFNLDALTADSDSTNPDVNADAYSAQVLHGYVAMGDRAQGTALEEAKAKLQHNLPLQYAFAEECALVLGSPDPANFPRIARVVELMKLVTDDDSFRPAFVGREAQARLLAHVLTLSAQEQHALKGKLDILEANTVRYEACRSSPCVRVFDVGSISTEFLVEMDERLRDRFDPELSSNMEAVNELSRRRGEDQQAFREDALSRAGESKAPAIDAIRGWKDGYLRATGVQMALCDLTDADDPDQAQGWQDAVAELQGIGEGECRLVYAYEDTVAEMKVALLRAEGGSLSPATAAKLAILERNASRMEAFMESDISRDKNFFDVDRTVLIPWWECVKDALAAATPQNRPVAIAASGSSSGSSSSSSSSSSAGTSAARSAGAVVLHTRPVAAQDVPARAAQPLQGPPLATGLPAVATGTAQPSQLLIAGENPVAPGQKQTGKFKKKAKDIRAAAARRATTEGARPIDAPPREASPPSRLLSRGLRLLASQDPHRTDRDPTGNERKKRRTPHHDASKHRWLSTALRNKFGRTGKSTAHVQAVNVDRK